MEFLAERFEQLTGIAPEFESADEQRLISWIRKRFDHTGKKDRRGPRRDPFFDPSDRCGSGGSVQ
jgi:hypothetical protein